MESLQDRYGADTICFGCGPLNRDGLQIKSIVDGDQVVADFLPAQHHQAFPGFINGGILGTLLDCHMNWTAAWRLMLLRGQDHPPVTVTARFAVELKAPTPAGEKLRIVAHVVELTERRADVEASIEAGGHVTATGTGTFVAIEEGHPAFERW